MPAAGIGVRLGIDPGDARIGVASSDPHGILATPVETVPRGERSAEVAPESVGDRAGEALVARKAGSACVAGFGEIRVPTQQHVPEAHLGDAAGGEVVEPGLDETGVLG